MTAGGDPLDEVVRLLDRHGVRYILVGARAAALHGFHVPTADTDVVPDDDSDNLRRLNDALREANMQVAAGLALPADHGWLVRRAAEAAARGTAASVPAYTDVGEIDVVLRASGVPGYADWRRRAEQWEVGGVQVLVGSLADIVASKEAAGREKDALHVPVLKALLDAAGGVVDDPAGDAARLIGRERPDDDALKAATWDWAARAAGAWRRERRVPPGEGLGAPPDDDDGLRRYHAVLERVGQAQDALAYLDQQIGVDEAGGRRHAGHP